MTIYSSNTFRSGIKVIFDKQPYLIESIDFVKPGKGKAFSRVKMRCLLNNILTEKIFKSTDFLQEANINETNLIYLYKDELFYYFMHSKTFEQYIIDIKIIGDTYKWLLENTSYTVILWNNRPIKVVPPNFIMIKIIETNPSNKSETIGKNNKIATLITGIKIKVPYFIKKGEIIKVDTRSGEYISRTIKEHR